MHWFKDENIVTVVMERDEYESLRDTLIGVQTGNSDFPSDYAEVLIDSMHESAGKHPIAGGIEQDTS